MAALLQMRRMWCIVAPLVQDWCWLVLEAGHGWGGAGVIVWKSILHTERIGHLSWYPGKALGIIFSDAVKFLQQTFSWGFWPETRLCSTPHL